jgi:hypothetical protein
VDPLKPVGDHIDALVHRSASRDALKSADHRAPRLPGGVIALTAIPAAAAVHGASGTLAIDGRAVRPMRARQFWSIVHPTFERVNGAGRYLEKKSA